MATVRSSIANHCPKGPKGPTIAGLSLPAASMHSEKARTAVLRAGPSPGDPWLGVVYGDRQVQMELRCRGDVLWSGVWQLDVRRNGRLAKPVSEWEEVLWVSDENVDYLDLASELGEGLRVERQILLARKDRFLFLADAILARQSAKLDYRACLPLAAAVGFHGAEESREGFLAARCRRAMVLPLALPEWRADGRFGSLAQTEHGLELCQSAEGRGMFAPLFFDLEGRRFGRELTWRRLTVAENLQAVADDAAVGFRARVGRQQWLIYRSLAAKANRTLLGHNLSTEMLVARFQRDGEVDSLLEIE